MNFVNRTLPFLHGRSLQITLTVTLSVYVYLIFLVILVIFLNFFREDIMKQKIPLCPKCPTPDLQVNYISFLNKKLNFNVFTSNILFANRLLKNHFLANVSSIKYFFLAGIRDCSLEVSKCLNSISNLIFFKPENYNY